MTVLAIMVWLALGSSDPNCEVIETTVSGNSMQGILWDGQKITVYTFGCGEPKRYDHMLFQHEETPNAVVKQIWGMPGDTLRVDARGKLFINDEQAKTPFGRPYILLGYSRKLMKKLEGKPLEGYVLLGHPGSLDSGRFGLIPKEDILGYVKQEMPYVEGAVSN